MRPVCVLACLLALAGCGGSGPSAPAQCVEARQRIRDAKAARDEAQARLAQAQDARSADVPRLEREVTRLRAEVDAAARAARQISDCDISDLVGPNVGR